MTDKMIINLPFAGFYNSHYDQELDYCLEREIEYRQEARELTASIKAARETLSKEYADYV